MNKILLYPLLYFFIFAPVGANENIRKLPLQLLQVQKHNPQVFTQGLVFDEGVLFESSGLYGKSLLLRSDDYSATAQAIDKNLFAEGITIVKDKLYMLTWRSGQLLVFNKNTLNLEKKIPYEGEGWGLTHNHTQLIMSNGSNQLLFRNRETFAIEKRLTINGLDKLNELEYVQGVIWANRWFDNAIYAIDANNGCILGKIDLTPLRRQAVLRFNENVVNGIAYHSNSHRLLVTGKFWAKQFFIQIPALDHTNCSS